MNNYCLRCGNKRGEATAGCFAHGGYWKKHLYTEGDQFRREQAEQTREERRKIRTNQDRLASVVFGSIGIKELEGAGLDKREVKIMDLRFGLSHPECMTLEDVGRELGVTRERIRSLEAKALKKYEVYYRNQWKISAIEQLEMRIISRMPGFHKMDNLPLAWVAEEAESLKHKYGATQTEFLMTEGE